MSEVAQLNRGLVVDVQAGESVALHPSTHVQRIVLTVESKTGQRSRIRIQSDDEVKIETPKRSRIA